MKNIMKKGMVYLDKVNDLGVGTSGIADVKPNATTPQTAEASIVFRSDGTGTLNQGGSQTSFTWNDNTPDLTGSEYGFQLSVTNTTVNGSGGGEQFIETTTGANNWVDSPIGGGGSISGSFSGNSISDVVFGFRARANNGDAELGDNGDVEATINITIDTTSSPSGNTGSQTLSGFTVRAAVLTADEIS